MKPRIKEDICYIEKELLPEMVHNRCFCESNSREYIELESSKIEPWNTHSYHLKFAFYRATIVIRFSGEPKIFYVLIKLLPENSMSTNDSDIALAYNGFLNEEIMWNKGALQYGKSFFPKFYLADMGKYNRPVIVIEDLEKNGFERVLDRELNKEEASLVMEVIGSFHGKGMMLKEAKFPIFREFYTKFKETVFIHSIEMETEKKFLRFTNQLKAASFDENILKEFEKAFENKSCMMCKDSTSESIYKSTSTICQGTLLRENLWFKKRKNEKMELRILDWQRVRCASNSIDLATILTQYEGEQCNDLIGIYINAVQQEQPAVSGEELRKITINPDFIYAFTILSFEKSNQLPKFFNILSNISS